MSRNMNKHYKLTTEVFEKSGDHSYCSFESFNIARPNKRKLDVSEKKNHSAGLFKTKLYSSGADANNHRRKIHRRNENDYAREKDGKQDISATAHSVSKPKLYCKICNQSFSLASSMSKHISYVHGRNENTCINAKEYEHLMQPENIVGEKEANNKSVIVDSQVIDACGDGNFSVNECEGKEGMNINTEEASSSLKEKEIRCNLCGKTYGTTRNLSRHLRYNHGKNVERSITKKEYDQLIPLDLSRENTGEPQQCITNIDAQLNSNCQVPVVCVYGDTKNNNLVYSEGEENETVGMEVIMPYEDSRNFCKICNKMYSSASNLSKHLRKFHQENVKGFITNKHYQKMSLQDLPEKIKSGHPPSEADEVFASINHESIQMTCKICKKTYSSASNLSKHLKYFHHENVKGFITKKDYQKMSLQDLPEKIKSGHPPSEADEFFASINHESIHMTCKICNKTYSSASNLSKHLKYFHQENVKGFITKKDYQKMSLQDLSEKIKSGHSLSDEFFASTKSESIHVTCKICNKTYIKEEKFYRHLKTFHGDFGRYLFNNFNDMKMSVQTTEFDRTYTYCKTCDSSHTSVRSLFKHWIETHRDKREHNTTDEFYLLNAFNKTEQCKVCMKSFMSLKNLKRHLVQEHNFNTRYWESGMKCKLCKRSSLSLRGLAWHMKREHGIRTDCITLMNENMECVKRLEENIKAEEHELPIEIGNEVTIENNVCTNDVPMDDTMALEGLASKISDIGNDFGESEQKNGHKTVNNSEEGEVCRLCWSKFSSLRSLKCHLARDHNFITKYWDWDSNLVCKLCKKRFTHVKMLKWHQTHKHNVSTIVNETEEAVKGLMGDSEIGDTEGNDTLDLEERYKTEECKLCRMKFFTERALKYHLSRHHGFLTKDWDKTEECKICKRRFACLRGIKWHMKNTHNVPSKRKPKLKKWATDERLCSIVCAFCERRFNGFNYYDAHLRKTHKIVLQTENHQFNTFEEFSHWRRATEREGYFLFYRSKGKETSPNSPTFYYCHCIGKKYSIEEGKKEPAIESNRSCPVRLALLRRKSGKIFVKYTKTHVGEAHGAALPNLAFPTEEEDPLKVAEMKYKSDLEQGLVGNSGVEKVFSLPNGGMSNLEHEIVEPAQEGFDDNDFNIKSIERRATFHILQKSRTVVEEIKPMKPCVPIKKRATSHKLQKSKLTIVEIEAEKTPIEEKDVFHKLQKSATTVEEIKPEKLSIELLIGRFPNKKSATSKGIKPFLNEFYGHCQGLEAGKLLQLLKPLEALVERAKVLQNVQQLENETKQQKKAMTMGRYETKYRKMRDNGGFLEPQLLGTAQEGGELHIHTGNDHLYCHQNGIIRWD